MLLPCLFNVNAEYIVRNAGLDEGWNQDCREKADDTTLMAENEE